MQLIITWAYLLLFLSTSAVAQTLKVSVGLITPLTGSRASIGEDSRKGADLAISHLAREGIAEIAIELEDSQGDPKTAIAAFQKQLNQGIRFFITQNSNVSLAIQPLIARHAALQLAITTTSDRYSTPGDLSFRMSGTTEGEARKMLEFLHTVHGKTMLLTMQDEYPVGLRKHLLSLGFNPFTQADFAPSETDFRAVLSKAHGYAAVVCLGYQSQCGLAAKQLRSLGNNALFLVCVPVNNREYFEIAGPAAEGSYVAYPLPDPGHFASTEFSSRFGVPINLFSSNAYDAVYLLGKTIHKCSPKVTPGCVGQELNRFGPYRGASGTKQFEPVYGDMTDIYTVLVAKSGKFVETN